MAETDNARELSPRPLMRILSDFAKTHGDSKDIAENNVNHCSKELKVN